MQNQAVEKKYYWGIDPGSLVMGYAILSEQGKLHKLGILTLKGTDAEKYRIIFKFIQEMLQLFPPKKIGIEAPFYGKNIQAMMKLARAQSVVITAMALAEIPCLELAPRLVKQWATGKGNASKEEVAEIMQRKFQLQNIPKQKDATDALAIAFCIFSQKENVIPTNQKQFSSWKTYFEKKKL